MKLWRKLAKKDPVSGTRNGRSIAYQLRMGETMGKTQAKTYPFLDALLKKAGISYVLTKKQQDQLKTMVKESQEPVDEAK